MIQAVSNNIIIKVATKYIGNISNILKLSAIENNSSVDPVDLVNIIGEVVSIPKSITNNKRGYQGFSTKDIQIGDTAIFRYDVIYSFIQKSPEADKSYKNRLWYEGQELWVCDIQKVFGVIRNGEIIMVNGYVMVSDFIEPKIILSQATSRVRGAQQSSVMHIGYSKENLKPIDVEAGDTVFYNPNLAAKYQIKGKLFRILQQNVILGKVV